jgi:hypothetical protein
MGSEDNREGEGSMTTYAHQSPVVTSANRPRRLIGRGEEHPVDARGEDAAPTTRRCDGIGAHRLVVLLDIGENRRPAAPRTERAG